jgi:hypothetical protein
MYALAPPPPVIPPFLVVPLPFTKLTVGVTVEPLGAIIPLAI